MPSPADPVLEARNVGRRYGYRPVLRDVTLALTPGTALLLTGRNGAGKTTLLRVLAGLARPTVGTVVRHALVGFVAHEAMIYDSLTLRENLRFFGRLHGGIDAARVDALLSRMNLADRADERASTLSRGMLQRLSIARALLSDPAILLLDEPLSGLDDVSAATVCELLAELRASNRAMIIVSHHAEALEGVGSHHARLAEGTLQPIEELHGG